MSNANHTIVNLAQCLQILGNKDSRKIGCNCYVERRGNGAAIRYWATDIVRYHETGAVSLDSAGYRTVTTKRNMNRYSRFSVWQAKGNWFIAENGSEPLEFLDGMTFDLEPAKVA